MVTPDSAEGQNMERFLVGENARLVEGRGMR
jgi:hypothetical protein